jgi:hypothetical protein
MSVLRFEFGVVDHSLLVVEDRQEGLGTTEVMLELVVEPPTSGQYRDIAAAH